VCLYKSSAPHSGQSCRYARLSSSLRTLLATVFELDGWLLLGEGLYHFRDHERLCAIGLLVGGVGQRIEAAEQPELLQITDQRGNVLGGFDLTAAHQFQVLSAAAPGYQAMERHTRPAVCSRMVSSFCAEVE
jgi:hypothetical protein